MSVLQEPDRLFITQSSPLLGLFLGLMLFLCACTTEATEEDCVSDEDCGEGQRCVAESCAFSVDALMDLGEVDTGPDEQCGSVICEEGQLCCEDACTDIQTDQNSCGACGASCGAHESCTGGECLCTGTDGESEVCAGTESCCPDKGCMNLQTDVLACGACTNNCVPGEVCVDGQCQCGPDGPCSAGESCCGLPGERQCVEGDPAVNPACDCGGVVCPADEVCSNGSCSTTCDTGFVSCMRSCINLQSNQEHCGQCGNKCPAGVPCINGSCELPCRPGGTVCSGLCVVLDSDRQNCGECGKTCAAGEICFGGRCQ